MEADQGFEAALYYAVAVFVLDNFFRHIYRMLKQCVPGPFPSATLRKDEAKPEFIFTCIAVSYCDKGRTLMSVGGKRESAFPLATC